MSDNIIYINEEAFFALFDKVVDHIKKQKEIKGDEWISGAETMTLLHITSKATLQKFRDEKRIEYCQLTPKLILYKRSSVIEYLERNTRKKK